MSGSHDPTESPQSDTLHTDTQAASSTAQRLEVPTLTILAHPDPTRVGEMVRLHDLENRRPVELSRLAPAFAAPGSSVLRPLADPHLSRQPIRLRRTEEGIAVARGESQVRVDVDGQRLAEHLQIPGERLARGAVLTLGRRIVLHFHFHHHRFDPVPGYGLVGASSGMAQVRREIRAVARLSTSVLLRGETGTGKELVARAIHDAAPRRDRPFVSVNLAAIPSSLAAAELFGAKRGAFTGADRDAKGYFAQAEGGTLFLDEIGETPTDVQPLLLRALENGEIQPVGSVRTRRVDVRVVAATDADLEQAIADGAFRSPLLHRLAGYEIHLPPLRRRPGDVGRLFFHFLHEALGEAERADLIGAHDQNGRPWPPAAWLARMAAYDWPGNVRQLRNVARRLAIARASDDPMLLASGLDPLLVADRRTSEPGEAAQPPADGSVEVGTPPQTETGTFRRASEVTEAELLRSLAANGYERKRTAEALGISRGALYYLIDQCPQVRKATDLTAEEIGRTLEQTGGNLIAAAADLGIARQALKRRMHALGLH